MTQYAFFEREHAPMRQGPMHALRILYAWEIETITRFLGASPRAPAPTSSAPTARRRRRRRRRPGCFCGSSPAIGTWKIGQWSTVSKNLRMSIFNA